MSDATQAHADRQLGIQAELIARRDVELAELRQCLATIADLADNMPSGADHDANPENTSPEDAVAHLAGLIWQIASRGD